MRDLKIDLVPSRAGIAIGSAVIEHISEEAFDPTQFVDEEKQRILAAVEKKIAGQEIVAPQHVETSRAEVIDLMTALRASLSEAGKAKSERPASAQATGSTMQRKPPVRATKSRRTSAQESRPKK